VATTLALSSLSLSLTCGPVGASESAARSCAITKSPSATLIGKSKKSSIQVPALATANNNANVVHDKLALSEVAALFGGCTTNFSAGLVAFTLPAANAICSEPSAHRTKKRSSAEHSHVTIDNVRQNRSHAARDAHADPVGAGSSAGIDAGHVDALRTALL
jgi:hypothetical protein